ncbi:dTDP-glucose 4,6-dehydratase [Ureibacillus chungkukjangi]|uniref:dTDP-glucose 4,6-dehydratase n=1 Tax=Ureibacillus chungkukjangi TaxID=1202712 RepID=A0A318TNU9_9BACL|nr:dTDP-glucose 4,6-dehydratase [Ureibacillus chungkukjangi]MCM3386881.1 dTDP-glucose 4,6-dehydratase [Ureibacillus chungkukjangi]PYF06063.1 dTDP-glucose 4,6-dehydratase [Ureibacillus chungkukjangi]
MPKKKVLVTGGAGFIGGNFVHYMVNQYPDYDIYNLDALTYAGDLLKHRAIKHNENYHFIHADIVDRAKMISLFERERFDFVLHFAAESHVDRSINEPSLFLQTNIMGTQALLDAALKVGVEKFVHISTDEVYGELDFDATLLFSESTPIQPNSPYSASKAASDFIVQAYHRTFGLPMNITRCSNNYGPYQYPEKLIPLTILSAYQEKSIPVYGNGCNVRDWLHVYDHCTAIDKILHEGVNGDVYNIGGHNERTNIEVVKTILSSLSKPETLIEFVEDRLGHDKRYAIDPTKLEQLGWTPKYSFEKGIEETVQWYLCHREWWEPLLLEKHIQN